MKDTATARVAPSIQWRVVAHGHRHVGFAGRDAEFAEQAAQRRVGAVVVHQERRVDGDGFAVLVELNLVGVGVPAEPGVGLVEGHVIAHRQDICGDQA